MNVFIFGNNKVCLEIIKFLNERQDINAFGVCLNEKQRQKYSTEIRQQLHENTLVIDVESLADDESLKLIKELNCSMVFSIYFGHVLSSEVINFFPQGIVNIHPAYLPFNGGSAPNVFCLLDDSPAGVILHYIDEGIDSGQIIVQEEIEMIDTGETIYLKLEEKSIELFTKFCSYLTNMELPSVIKPTLEGTVHRHSELIDIDRIFLDKSYKGRDLINLLRARTFRPYESAYFLDDLGRKVFIRVEL